jgi:DNA-binding NarL/FixJ family response regulator
VRERGRRPLTSVVGENTVEAHLSHAYARLGVRSRAQLAARLATNEQLS